MKTTCCIIALASSILVGAIDNGLGRTPPMGWRSWNSLRDDVDQQKMEDVMDRLTQRNRSVDGRPTSLADLGYNYAGLDDNWQACGTGVHGSFHDADGNPLVNTQRFPSLANMTAYGQARGLRVGWYLNNCICSESMFKSAGEIASHMSRTAAAVARYGFDAVKLDGCGQFRNLTWWASLLNATGTPFVIENCHIKINSNGRQR